MRTNLRGATLRNATHRYKPTPKAAYRLMASTSCASLAVLLMIVDQTSLLQNFTYLGIGNSAVSPSRVFAVVIMSAVVGAILPGPNRLPGALVVWVLAIVVVIPAIALTPQREPVWFLATVAPVIGLVAVVATFAAIRVQFTIGAGLTRMNYLWCLALMTFLLLSIVVVEYGLTDGLTSFESMYQVRAEVEIAAASSSPIAAYSSGFVLKILAPALTGLGILWRRYAFTTMGVAAFYVDYLTQPSKLAVFLAVLTAVTAVYLRASRREFRASTVAWFVALMTITVSLLFPQPGNIVFATTVYRTIYVPLEVGLMWMRHFSQNPLGLFADALPFISNGYELSLPKLISVTYGSGQGNINAHLWVDGYANMGFWGVVIVSALLGITLIAVNVAARGRDMRASMLILLGPSVSLTNGSMFTSLLSGGLALAILLVALLPRQGSTDLRSTELRGVAQSGGPSGGAIDQPGPSVACPTRERSTMQRGS